MAIAAQQARAIFTQVSLEKYKESIPAPSFLKSFFDVKTSSSLLVSIEVQRGSELVAPQVKREQKANMNQFALSTEKIFKPPFYAEGFDITQMDKYDVTFGSDNITGINAVAELAGSVGEKYAMLRSKIERAKEIQASEVFETGVVTTKFGTNIDYKRKATSMVDVGATDQTKYWANAAADVEAQLIAGAEFCRNSGKTGASEFHYVMSGAALVALKKTTYFTTLANFQNVQLLDIRWPQKEAFGAGYHGRITAGAYTFHLWTYDEVYVNDSAVVTRYWPEDYAFMVPVVGTRLLMAHGGFPQIMGNSGNSEGIQEFISYQAGEYGFNNYITEDKSAHIFELKSAPLAVPVTVDMMYTMQILGTVNPQQG